MTVEISGHDPEKVAPIQAAAEKEWPFGDWWFSDNGVMRAYAQASLCGGECEEQFTERLSIAIWRANGGFCEVVVNATYLENLPYEIHMLDQSDHDRLMQSDTRRNET
jgi:hypothetical protein